MAAFLYPRTKVKILGLEQFFDATPFTTEEITNSAGKLQTGDHYANVVLPANDTNDDVKYTFEVYANEEATGVYGYVTVKASLDEADFYKPVSMTAFPETLDMDGGTVTMQITFSLDTGMIAVTGLTDVFLDLNPGGDEHKLGGTIEPSDATNQTITWTARYTAFEGIDEEDFDDYVDLAEATITDGDTIVVTENGSVELIATIRNGIDNRTDYVKKFEATAVCVDSLVTSIENMPSHVHGLSVTFTDALVLPFTRTNQDIIFTVKDAGETGAVMADDRTLTASKFGDVVINAKVEWNDVTSGEAEEYDEDFTITLCQVEVPVLALSGVPSDLIANTSTSLDSVKVYPADATNQDIEWSAVYTVGDGTASVDALNNLVLSDHGGEVQLTATITDGLSTGSDYTKTFTIITTRSTTVVEED